MKRELHKVIRRIAEAIWLADRDYSAMAGVQHFEALSADMQAMYYDFARVAYEEMLCIEVERAAA